MPSPSLSLSLSIPLSHSPSLSLSLSLTLSISLCLPDNQLKRKSPRRSSWRHGIIRKKKIYLKKETGEELDDEEEEHDGWVESEDAGLGKDGEEESLCELEPPTSAANDSAQHNGHTLFAEEESSSEALALTDGHDSAHITAPDPAHEPEECVNGDESLSSLDSQTAMVDKDTCAGAAPSEAGHSGNTGAGETTSRVEEGGARGEGAVQEEAETESPSVPSDSEKAKEAGLGAESSEGDNEREGNDVTLVTSHTGDTSYAPQSLEASRWSHILREPKDVELIMSHTP